MLPWRKPQTIRNPHAEEHRAPVGRLWLVALAFLALLGGFGLRVYYLTVLRGPFFEARSENNYLFSRPVSAPRGNMLSADGETLALNSTTYSIEMTPLGMKPEQIEQTVAELAKLLDRPELRKKAATVAGLKPAWKTVALAQNLALEAVAPVLERTYQLPGIIIEPEYSRQYPAGSLAGHLTGYVGPIAQEQAEDYKASGYLPTDMIGLLGAERQFETLMRGEHGREVYIRDARGRPRSSWIETAARRGSDVILTINMRLQRAAELAIEGHKGAAIVMDPRDGSILALVSKPDYDPNNPAAAAVGGTTSSFNRAIRGRYAPASTFKLVTAAAGLVQGRGASEEIDCGGNFMLANSKRPFWCDVRSGHGSLDLYGAIQRSCNVFFFTWADELGYDRLVRAARDFGFGDPTGIDLMPPGRETGGTLGRDNPQSVFKGSVIQMGIGQGALIAASPLQLVNAYAALANGGTLHRPHIFKEARNAQGEIVEKYEGKILHKLSLRKGQREILVEGLRRVIQEKGGTAFNRGFKPEWNAAGKTGSAEVSEQEMTNGWFVGFAPADNPEVCIVALIEAEGHGGNTAAPIVRDLMAEYFEGTPKALAAAENGPGIAQVAPAN